MGTQSYRTRIQVRNRHEMKRRGARRILSLVPLSGAAAAFAFIAMPMALAVAVPMAVAGAFFLLMRPE